MTAKEEAAIQAIKFVAETSEQEDFDLDTSLNLVWFAVSRAKGADVHSMMAKLIRLEISEERKGVKK